MFECDANPGHTTQTHTHTQVRPPNNKTHDTTQNDVTHIAHDIIPRDKTPLAMIKLFTSLITIKAN